MKCIYRKKKFDVALSNVIFLLVINQYRYFYNASLNKQRIATCSVITVSDNLGGTK